MRLFLSTATTFFISTAMGTVTPPLHPFPTPHESTRICAGGGAPVDNDALISPLGGATFHRSAAPAVYSL